MTTLYDTQNITTFDEFGCRFYHVHDKDLMYPSITSVLGHTMSNEKSESLQKWRDSMGHAEADAFTKEAARRGTSVHYMLEQFFDGVQPNQIDYSTSTKDDIDMFRSIIKFNAKNVTKVYCQEIPLYSTVLEVAGRVDLVGEWKGVPAIIDFKTSGRMKNDKDIEDYWQQICFYAVAYNELYGTNIDRGVIMMGVKNGLPRIWCIDNLLECNLEKLINRISIFYKGLLNETD